MPILLRSLQYTDVLARLHCADCKALDPGVRSHSRLVDDRMRRRLHLLHVTQGLYTAKNFLRTEPPGPTLRTQLLPRPHSWHVMSSSARHFDIDIRHHMSSRHTRVRHTARACRGRVRMVRGIDLLISYQRTFSLLPLARLGYWLAEAA